MPFHASRWSNGQFQAYPVGGKSESAGLGRTFALPQRQTRLPSGHGFCQGHRLINRLLTTRCPVPLAPKCDCASDRSRILQYSQMRRSHPVHLQEQPILGRLQREVTSHHKWGYGACAAPPWWWSVVSPGDSVRPSAKRTVWGSQSPLGAGIALSPA